MGFRHIAAIVVSLVVFFILVVSLLVGEYPPPEVFAPFILVVLIVSGTISLFIYGIKGIKFRRQDKVTKEDITRIETSINELRKRMDEIHEYIADMYITHDEERSRLK